MRIRLTLSLDVQRHRDVETESREYVPEARAELAEPRRIGFAVEPPSPPDHED